MNSTGGMTASTHASTSSWQSSSGEFYEKRLLSDKKQLFYTVECHFNTPRFKAQFFEKFPI